MLAGASARTLRLYDERGLLVPERRENGYRVCSAEDERRLEAQNPRRSSAASTLRAPQARRFAS